MTIPPSNYLGYAKVAKTPRKSHKGVQSRIENMTRLVAEFRTRELTRRDGVALFDFSQNGAGKYCNDLLNGEIIEISRFTEHSAKTPGRPVYWLTASEEKIADFLAKVAVKTGNAEQFKKAKVDKSRQFHVMHDDTAFKVKLHRAPVAADPMALPADFFRPPAMIFVSPPCAHFAMPVIPPKPQGFPVPGAHLFELGAQP